MTFEKDTQSGQPLSCSSFYTPTLLQIDLNLKKTKHVNIIWHPQHTLFLLSHAAGSKASFYTHGFGMSSWYHRLQCFYRVQSILYLCHPVPTPCYPTCYLQVPTANYLQFATTYCLQTPTQYSISRMDLQLPTTYLQLYCLHLPTTAYDCLQLTATSCNQIRLPEEQNRRLEFKMNSLEPFLISKRKFELKPVQNE